MDKSQILGYLALTSLYFNFCKDFNSVCHQILNENFLLQTVTVFLLLLLFKEVVELKFKAFYGCSFIELLKEVFCNQICFCSI